MADTSQHHAAPDVPVEGDGISYSGIGWFVVVLVVTTVFVYALMWGMFVIMERRADPADTPRPELALPVGTSPRPPNLLLDEPANLRDFRETEQLLMTTYGWQDRNAGTVRIPIDRAKDLLIERGLPVRGTDAGGGR